MFSNYLAYLKGLVDKKSNRYTREEDVGTGWTNLISNLKDSDLVLVSFVEKAGSNRVITVLVRMGDLGSGSTIAYLSGDAANRFDVSKNGNTLRCARQSSLNASNYVIALVL